MSFSASVRLAIKKTQPLLVSSCKSKLPSRKALHSGNGITNTGAVLPEPSKVTFGLIKVSLMATPCILVGGTISREFATWLEENELFVPEDDDD